jgi:two-component system nitrogen regulation response regulator GlnG
MPGSHGYDLLKYINDNFEEIPVIIMTAFTDMQAAIDSYGGGAFEYMPKPFDLDEAIEIVNRALEGKPATKGLKGKPSSEIIGKAASMQMVFRAIGKLSNTNATVLIQGESGTGKELIAKSLHKNSPRNDMPFVALNMADIPKELVESELFGHEKGAFTGAVDRRIGRFEQANGGTLFLDEIGDMPLECQTRLLRVLSNKEFYRVGGDKPIKVDVRILAATHQDLHSLVSLAKFREDLFYRLNVIRIEVPKLKDRHDDIKLLATAFLKMHSDALGEELRVLSKEALEFLEKYDWPGNVRQLENICYWLTLMSPTQNIKVEDLPSEVKDHEAQEVEASSDWEQGLAAWLKELSENKDSDLLDIVNPKLDKILIQTALEKTNGRKNEAAVLLGWGRNTLSKKIKELGL